MPIRDALCCKTGMVDVGVPLGILSWCFFDIEEPLTDELSPAIIQLNFPCITFDILNNFPRPQANCYLTLKVKLDGLLVYTFNLYASVELRAYPF